LAISNIAVCLGVLWSTIIALIQLSLSTPGIMMGNQGATLSSILSLVIVAAYVSKFEGGGRVLAFSAFSGVLSMTSWKATSPCLVVYQSLP
jgi:hypothetical protein